MKLKRWLQTSMDLKETSHELNTIVFTLRFERRRNAEGDEKIYFIWKKVFMKSKKSYFFLFESVSFVTRLEIKRIVPFPIFERLTWELAKWLTHTPQGCILWPETILAPELLPEPLDCESRVPKLARCVGTIISAEHKNLHFQIINKTCLSKV